MLPLLQIPPHAMTSPSPTFDSLATFPNHDAGSTNPFGHYRRETASYPTQRALPIRISQAPRRATTTSSSLYQPRSEHHLRRKTPNGTIDAGYDASPTQLFQEPPPLKHMVLPGQTTSATHISRPPHPFHLRQSRPNTAGFSTPRESVLLNNGAIVQPEANPWPSPNTFHEQLQDPIPAGMQFQSATHLQVSPNAYQSLIRANEYNVRAFCPPPPTVNDTLPLGHIPLHLQMVNQMPGIQGYQNSDLPHSAHLNFTPRQDFGPGPYDAFPNYTGLSKFETPTDIGPSLDFAHTRTQQHHTPFFDQTGNSLAQGRTPGNMGPPVQLGFREKALAQAHKCYVDLVSYHQSMRRSHSNKGTPGLTPTPRLLVYPKPPRPLSSFSRGSPSESPGVKSRGNPFKPQHASGTHLSHRTFNPSAPVFSNMETNRPSSFRGAMCQSRLEPGLLDYHNEAHTTPYPRQPQGTPSPQGSVSPMASAKASLDILNSLCEQSGWNWMDGMLLGGCLHYLMERFEEALEWFSRIITLDSSHVEAITNTAATLYCLNRQAEAEQQWLRALKLRPNYLEAAEHLVGLLYKKRSRDAIGIISYVQDALKSPVDGASPPPHLAAALWNPNEGFRGTSVPYSNRNTDMDQAQHRGVSSQRGEARVHGFGSSGYAIPGRENGRIAALIHVKGTMLYGLKEIDKASKSFEEAVLISAGRGMSGIRDLVRRIQTVLSPTESRSGPYSQLSHSPQPLLLPPEKARHTAQLVFGGSGELPGLRYVPEGPSKRAALQTTSNSLLSLAKIFQDAMSNGKPSPDILRRPSGVGDILALYYLSLSLQESPSTANNVGILLAGVQQAALSAPSNGQEVVAQPNIPGIQPGSGLALALAYYHYGLRLDPKHVHLHTNLGSLLKDIGQLDLAIQMYEQAVSCDGGFDIALTNLANAVKDRGRINDAILYYKRAVNSNPDFSEAVCGLLTALNSVCDWRGRGGVVLHSGRFDRWHVDDKGHLVDAQFQRHGSGLTWRVVGIVRRQLDEASQWGRGVLDEKTITALAACIRGLCSNEAYEVEEALRNWAGKPWEGSRLVRLVERATRVAQRKWFCDRYISRLTEPLQYSRPRLHPNLAVPSAPTVLPFHTFTYPLDAKEIRLISQRNAIRISSSTLRLPWIPSTVYPPPSPPNPHLNVGYVSSDFNNHPLAHLMQSVFGLHNPQRVKAFCYATTPSDRSVHRQQIEREAPVFRDVSSWSSDRLVEQIVQDGIHVLVNLNGYTRGARNEIFAARPAPIQMSFMGFAGTLGAEWCDYILADSTAVPAETLRPYRENVGIEDVFNDNTEGEEGAWMYSENIIFCRDTFFCCDHAQSSGAGERGITWEEEQERRWKMRKELFPTLHDDTVILGNFNQLYKIEPTTFRSWLRILAKAPKAVLWLLRFPELGEANLRRTAKAWAGAEVASRLIFTDVAPKNQHISRARVCDLFLDTPECNAHTTAADVLWSSTPLLTLPRYPYKMCSRMAASILKGALPKSEAGRLAAEELIAKDETEYERMAVRLVDGFRYRITREGYGQGQGRLAEVRKLLWDSKWSCGLFDTTRWVKEVETAYEEAWRRWVTGTGGDIHL